MARSATLMTLTAQAAGTVTGPDFDYYTGGQGAGIFVIDITARAGGTPTVVFTIEGKDQASGKYYTILQSASLGPVATTVLRVFVGATPASNLAVNDMLPRTIRVTAVVTSAGTITATVGASLV